MKLLKKWFWELFIHYKLVKGPFFHMFTFILNQQWIWFQINYDCSKNNARNEIQINTNGVMVEKPMTCSMMTMMARVLKYVCKKLQYILNTQAEHCEQTFTSKLRMAGYLTCDICINILDLQSTLFMCVYLCMYLL